MAAVLTQEARLTDDLSARGSALLVAQIERMSPDERARYAAALTEGRRGRRGDRGGDGGPGRGPVDRARGPAPSGSGIT